MTHLLGRVTGLLLLSLAVAPDVHAAPPCSNRDFNGVYGTIARGALFVLPPVFAIKLPFGHTLGTERLLSLGAKKEKMS